MGAEGGEPIGEEGLDYGSLGGVTASYHPASEREGKENCKWRWQRYIKDSKGLC